MENKIPTAEEFIKDKLSEIHDENIYEDLLKRMFKVDVTECMIEFAKLHVEAALESATDKLPYDDKLNQDILLKQEILNAYPENLIK